MVPQGILVFVLLCAVQYSAPVSAMLFEKPDGTRHDPFSGSESSTDFKTMPTPNLSGRTYGATSGMTSRIPQSDAGVYMNGVNSLPFTTDAKETQDKSPVLFTAPGYSGVNPFSTFASPLNSNGMVIMPSPDLNGGQNHAAHEMTSPVPQSDAYFQMEVDNSRESGMKVPNDGSPPKSNTQFNQGNSNLNKIVRSRSAPSIIV